MIRLKENSQNVRDKNISKKIYSAVFSPLFNLKNKIWTGDTKVALIACLIGILTGILIGIYSILMNGIYDFFFVKNIVLSGYEIPKYVLIPVPAAGGLIVGFVLKHFLSVRYGVDSVIEAAALHGGRLQTKYALGEAFASIITIGTGGSAGKEAPAVLMGAGVSSLVSKIFNLRGGNLRTYLGCGSAAGVAAAFSAPLSGIVFVIELIIGELQTKTFIPIVLAAISSTFVYNALFQKDALSFPHFFLVEPFREIWLFLILGLLAGLVSVLFIRFYYYVREKFTKMNVSIVLKPAIGGLAVGVFGYFCPEILGLGYETILRAVTTPYALQYLLILMILKIAAYSFTIGSRGAGGSIVPSLFVGAMLGSAFGIVCNELFPEVSINPGAYAIAGMGAVFAGTSNAMFTAVILLTEMTQDYNMVLPFAFACVVSNGVARAYNPESIFTEMLKRKGYTIRGGREVDVMASLFVKDSMNTLAETVQPNIPVSKLVEMIQKSKHLSYPVVNSEGELEGIVTIDDTRNMAGDPKETRVYDIMTHKTITAYPFETLDKILERFIEYDVYLLPVVMKSNPKKLIGVITRNDIIKTYNKNVLTKVQSIGSNDEDGPGTVEYDETSDLTESYKSENGQT